MRRVAVVFLGLAAVVSIAAGCRSQETRVCDADRGDLEQALAALRTTAAKPDDAQKHAALRDRFTALSKRIEANRVPRLDTEDPSELTMRALDKLAMAQNSMVEALDPKAPHPLSAAQVADANNVEGRADLLTALDLLRAQCEK